MNERVKILWAKAAESNFGDSWEEQTAFMSKFAELIVRECMACSTWVGKMNTNSIEPVHTAHAINQRIKQHFGVEE
jgi:hypothetical protein